MIVSKETPSRSAVGFFTHLCDAEIISRYRKLKADLAGRAETTIVAPMGTPVPEDLLAETVFFDFAQLAAKAPRILGSKVIPGNCHLTMLAFFGARPGFDYYWHIEYDVVFTGDWRTLLDAWRKDASDLVAAHVRTRGEEPDWPWWPSLHVSSAETAAGHLRAFLPVYRISRRALERLEMAVREGSSGHFEALVPTVLQAASLRISDLGEERFYTSSTSPDGELRQGTLRYRPFHARPLPGRNLLYHPVKPESFLTAPRRLQALALRLVPQWVKSLRRAARRSRP
jgi:hypothetical protein